MSKKIFLAIIFMFISLTDIQAAEYVDVTAECEAKVLQITDGESMIVELVKTKELAMIKMIGVDASESTTAVRFLNSELMGKTVVLVPDPHIGTPEGRWSMVYIFTNNDLFNKKIIVQGHAKVETLHSNAAYYTQLTDQATRAELERVGQWAEDNTSVKNLSYSAVKVNINTADLAQLQTLLYGVDYYLAERIISYRQKSPFRTVGEIKFVLGFTKELFDNNRDRMTVSTNIADASREELATLTRLSESDINTILEYRSRNRIASSADLLDILSDSTKYADIQQYIDVMPVADLVYSDLIANINTASLPQLMSAGLEYVPASLILDTRNENDNKNPTNLGGTSVPYKRNYTFKTLGELMHFPGINFTFDQINAISGKIRLKTDINKAEYNELQSLQPYVITLPIAVEIIQNRYYSELSDIMIYLPEGSFEVIKKYIYVDTDIAPSRVNINTANSQQLAEAGFSSGQIDLLLKLNKLIKSSWDIPFDLGELDNNTALFTNINTAQYKEIMSLNNGMTTLIASDILSYRDNQPIGSMEELRQIFVDRNAGSVYESLKDFIVLR